MKTRTSLYILLAFLTLPACNFFTQLVSGGPVGPTGGGSTNPAVQQYQYIFGTPTNPISLTLALDDAHKAQALIPHTGGQISATGADGTVYTLDIPKNALEAATTITLTPISKVTGLPGSGPQTYAVQMAPEGLYFYNDAILTITPAKPIPLAKQVFFDFKAGGQTVGLAIPVVESKEIKLRLMHFSGYGVTDGGPATTTAVQQQLGGDPEAALQSLTASVIDQMRQDQQNGVANDHSQAQTLLDLIDQWGNQVVKPALEAAGTSCSAGKEAIRQVLGMERMRQLLGMGASASGADLVALLTTAAKTCVQEEYQRCVTEHVIHKMIPLWLGLKRQYQLLGGSESGPEPEEVKLAESLTVKCLTFELRFHSQGIFTAGDAGYDSTVDGKVTLHFDPGTFTISGSAPLDNQAFKFKLPKNSKTTSCVTDSTPGGSTFEVKKLDYIQDQHSATDTEGYVRDFNMVYFPGVTSESYHIHCQYFDGKGKLIGENDYTSPPSGYWTGIFFVVHQDELNAESGAQSGNGGLPPMPDLSGMLNGGAQSLALPAMPAPAMPEGGGFVADTWNVTVGDLLASKDWTRSNDAAGITEVGTLKLFHRPGQ